MTGAHGRLLCPCCSALPVPPGRVRREKAQALTCFLYLSLEALNFPLVTTAQGSGHCRPYAILPHLTACRGRRHLSVLRGWRELPWLRAPLSLQGDNGVGRTTGRVNRKRGLGGETRLPRAPSALPSCRDARGDRGFFGGGSSPLGSPESRRPDRLPVPQHPWPGGLELPLPARPSTGTVPPATG